MNRIYLRGALKRWNDDKGFGFIGVKNGGGDVFIHISALETSRRPVVGGVIVFQVDTDKHGRKRAVNARIEGVERAEKRLGRRAYQARKKHKLNSSALPLLVLLVTGLLFYGKFFVNNSSFENITSTTDISRSFSEGVSYTCDGRVYCSEMTSCAEATFFLQNCPGTKMDDDRDGVTCESQWCGW
jgi:cold shock CspA family protein